MKNIQITNLIILSSILFQVLDFLFYNSQERFSCIKKDNTERADLNEIKSTKLFFLQLGQVKAYECILFIHRCYLYLNYRHLFSCFKYNENII